MTEKAELLATLIAYEHMVRLCWPGLHPELTQRRISWTLLDVRGLNSELDRLMEESSNAPQALRVFWKEVPGFTFRGANAAFAKDAGHASVRTLLGLTDFSKEVPWNRQAPLYRKDDEEVVKSLREKLNIVQRQDQSSDTIYLHAAKVPIVNTRGAAIGLMGAYTLIDAVTASRLLRQ